MRTKADELEDDELEEDEEYDEDEDEEESEEEYDEEDESEEDDYHVPVLRKPRAETVMVAVAILAAIALVVVLVICLPQLSASDEEDPEALLQQQRQQEEAELKQNPIEEEPTEETQEPTIPPESNPYDALDFQYNSNNYLLCTQQDSYPGIDVSQYQKEIDWESVASSGIRFAMVRLGYRGWGKAGKLVEDEYAKQNLTGAQEAGIELGAYFFSQATSIEEVDEEIEFLLEILGDTWLDMPIVLDWEVPYTDGSSTPRTASVDGETVTACLLHFCQVMEEKGYEPMVYFNWSQSRTLINLHELEDYPFWLALYQDRMTYPYRVEMWQYTCTGTVPGISGDVDIDVFMPDSRKS